MRCHVSPPLRPPPPASPKRRPSQSCISFLHRVSFRSRRQRLPGGAALISRVSHGRAPAFAPARFARLIARASPAQGTRLPSVPMGFFRAGAKRETKRPPDAASSCPILPRISQGSSPYRELFRIIRTNHGFRPGGLIPASTDPASGSSPRTPIRGPAPAVSACREGRKIALLAGVTVVPAFATQHDRFPPPPRGDTGTCHEMS